MKLPKAVEILKLAISDPDMVDANDLVKAQKLGAQALNQLTACQAGEIISPDFLLPGEDPE